MAGAVSQAVWSNLFYLYMAIALVVGALVTGWTLITLWRFRARAHDVRPPDAPRAGYITSERGHVLGAYVMAGAIAAIMFGLAFSTIDAVNFIEIPPVDEPSVNYEVVGFQFGWQIRYFATYVNETTGEEVPFNFTKVNDMRVPVNTVVTASVTSRDVQHVFGIPDYRIQIYAAPGSILPIWFKATETGEVPLRCLRNCGVGHDDMIKAAKLTVLSQADYDAFIAENAPKQAPAQQTPAEATQARALLLEEGQLVADEPTVDAGADVQVKVMNRAPEARTFGVGPVDAPWATAVVPAGEDGIVSFTAPESGAIPVWAMADGSSEPEAVESFEVISQ